MPRRCTRRKVGGRGARLERVLNFHNARIIGAGGYGLVVKSRSKDVYKLFFDLNACAELKKEVIFQQKVKNILQKYLPEVGVPNVTYFSDKQITDFQNQKFLCGIGMEYLPPPSDFEEAVHIILGQSGDDLNTSWGQKQSLPVSETNPTRGFFASPEMMEAIWEEEGSEMTLTKMSELMGRAYRILIDHGIVPTDVEWVWSKGKPWMIDFGLFEEKTIHPKTFLASTGVSGLSSDFQVPHKGDRGQESFLHGFLPKDDAILPAAL